MTHFNAGRKQTPEQIAKRVESTRIAKGLWSAERYEQYRMSVSVSAKGRPAWNKGVSLSDETKRKLSESHKGIHSGEKHPMFGKHHTDDSKIKNSLAHRGRKQTEEVVKKRVEAMSWYRHSMGTKVKIGAANSGEENGNWNGGASREPYALIWGSGLFKKSIRERDGHSCQNPECKKNCSVLSIHHIDYDKNNCNPNNLITLCVSCNARANFNRDFWEAGYKEIIRLKYEADQLQTIAS